MDNITKQQNFWSENDDLVLKAIREGFLKTQNDMWGDLENWAKTGSGLPSTAGTTASIAFIRRGKIFVGHVGDSAIGKLLLVNTYYLLIGQLYIIYYITTVNYCHLICPNNIISEF